MKPHVLSISEGSVFPYYLNMDVQVSSGIRGPKFELSLHLLPVLTHLSLMGFPILINWTSPFPF